MTSWGHCHWKRYESDCRMQKIEWWKWRHRKSGEFCSHRNQISPTWWDHGSRTSNPVTIKMTVLFFVLGSFNIIDDFENFLQLNLDTMLLPRRLYHCSRCLHAESTKGIILPAPSLPEPILHPKVSHLLATPRVSLSPDSMRKVPQTDWNTNNNKEPFTQDRKTESLKAVHRKLFKQEPLGDRLKVNYYPPIPAPSIRPHRMKGG